MHTSTTPNAPPSQAHARITVRTPADPSAPRRERGPSCRCPVVACDGGVSANQSVPTNPNAPAVSIATAGEATAAIPPIRTGPRMNASSCIQASSANAVSRRSSLGSMLGHSERMQAPIGGIVAPVAAAHTTSTSAEEPSVENSTKAPSEIGKRTLSGSRMRAWPRRSTRRPTTGAATPLAIERAATTPPTTAYEFPAPRTSRTAPSGTMPSGSRPIRPATTTWRTLGARNSAA